MYMDSIFEVPLNVGRLPTFSVDGPWGIFQKSDFGEIVPAGISEVPCVRQTFGGWSWGAFLENLIFGK